MGQVCPSDSSTRTHEISEEAASNESNNVTEEGFTKASLALVKLAADGEPGILRSTYAKRNELLREHSGDQHAAALAVKEKGSSLASELREVVLGLIPYVGLPLAMAKPMWASLRRACLIAAIYGHNLKKEEVLGSIMMVVCGTGAKEKLFEKGLETSARLAWQLLCKKLGFGLVAKLPVGKLVAVLPDFEGAARQELLDKFKEGRQEVPESVYKEVLDTRPSASDVVKALQKKGKKKVEDFLAPRMQTLEQIKAKAGF